MPFWSKGNNDDAPPASRDFTSSDEAAYSSSSSFGAPAGGGNTSSAAAAAAAEMQQMVGALQQQAIIQDTISNLADKAFEKCITKPGDSLSGREAACVEAVSLKFLDTNQFLVQRMQKKMNAGQQQQAF
jgi:hypothetical protein